MLTVLDIYSRLGNPSFLHHLGDEVATWERGDRQIILRSDGVCETHIPSQCGDPHRVTCRSLDGLDAILTIIDALSEEVSDADQ